MAGAPEQIAVRIEGCPDDFVVGGAWTVRDAGSPDTRITRDELWKAARADNQKIYGGRYAGACADAQAAPGAPCAYGLFAKTPPGSRSLAALAAMSFKDDGKLRVRLYHLKGDGGSEVVWMLIVDHGVVQVDGDSLMDLAAGEEFFRNPPEEYAEAEVDDIPAGRAMTEFAGIWKDLDRKAREGIRIRDFSAGRRRMIAIGCACAALLAAAGGVLWWWMDAREERLLLERKQRLELEAGKRISALRKSEFGPVWLKSPPPVAVIGSAIEKEGETPLSINGWILSSLSLEKGRWIAAYSRDPNGPWLPPPGRVEGGKPLSAIVETEMREIRGSREEGLMKLADAERWLGGLSFGMPFRISWKLFPPERKAVRIGRRQIDVKSAWQRVSLEISGLASLSGMEAALDAPGLVIDSLSFEEDEWKINATLYVLP